MLSDHPRARSNTLGSPVARFTSAKVLNRVAAVAAAGALAAFVLSGCGSSKSKTSATASTTTTLAPLPVTPVIAVPTSFGDSTAGLDTPEAAAQNLWDSWRDDDKTRAVMYASNAAVATLFATPWGPEDRNQGCGTATGVLRCVYTLAKGARVTVIDPTPDGKFRVSAVQIVDALPSSDRLNSDLVDNTVPGVSGTTAGTGLDAGSATGGVVGQDGVVTNDSIVPYDPANPAAGGSPDTAAMGPGVIAGGTVSSVVGVFPTVAGSPVTAAGAPAAVVGAGAPVAGAPVATITTKAPRTTTKAKTTKKRKPSVTTATSPPSTDTPIPVDAGQSPDSAVG